jgi:hypothetical protein
VWRRMGVKAKTQPALAGKVQNKNYDRETIS